jgi:hypothetical protein
MDARPSATDGRSNEAQALSNDGTLDPLTKNQNEDGVDLARLEANLRLTPTVRVEKLQRVARFICEVRHAAHAAGLRETD